MSIIDKILGRSEEVKQIKPQKTDKNSEVGTFVAPAFTDSIPPSRKDLDRLEGTTMGWVYACANAIANEVASTEICLYRQTSEGPVEVENHPLLDLLYKVNDFTTHHDHFYRTQMFLEGVGEAPWYLQRTGKTPTSMILLRPDRLYMSYDSKSVIGGYKYRKENGQEVNIASEDIIFLRNPSVLSDFRGMGTLQAAAVTVDSEEFAEKWNRNFFYNGARPDFVLESDQKLSQPVIDRLKRLWESLYKGVNNAHKMAVLEQGIRAKSLGLNQKDMDFLEQLRWSRDKILGIFQVPKSILGITEDVNRANAEAAYYTFARFTIKPRIERIVEQLNEFLVPQFGADLYLDFDDPTPDNMESKGAYYRNALDGGWMTTNEVRAEENLPPLRGGDTVLKPFGLQPAFSLEKQPKLQEEKSMRQKIHTARGYGRIESKREAVAKALEPLAMEVLKKQIRADAKSKQKQKSVVIEAKDVNKLVPLIQTTEERDAFQKMLNVKSIAKFETLMQKKTEASFTQQMRIVVENLMNQNTVKIPRVRGRKKDLGDAEARAKAEELLKAIWDTDATHLEEILSDNLSPIMLEIVREQAFNTANYLNLSVGDITNDPKVAEQINKMTIKLSGDINQTTRDNIRQALVDGVMEGEGVQKITSRVQSVFEQAGSVRAEMIARSESIRASNYAAEETYKASGVRYKEWITASDERTCPFCDTMDGKQLEVGGDFFKTGQTMSVDGEDMRFNYLDVQGPPLHPNCRCTLGPVIETT